MATHTKRNSPISVYFQKLLVVLLRGTVLPATAAVVLM